MVGRLKSLAIASCLAVSVGAAFPAKAGTIQLGFILDRSGSIGGTDWNVIIDGLSSAIASLIPVGGADTYEVSIVSFANSASVDIARRLVTDAAARTTLSTDIFNLGDGRSNDVYIGGGTNFADAFQKMNDALTPTIAGASFSYVNFSTDGVGTDGTTQRQALINLGVDNISVEGIGGGVNVATLTGSYCYPQPCDTTSPYSFPTNGFYIGVDNAQQYVAAIGNKIRIVTGQVPEPGSLALIGLALAGLGFARRKLA